MKNGRYEVVIHHHARDTYCEAFMPVGRYAKGENLIKSGTSFAYGQTMELDLQPGPYTLRMYDCDGHELVKQAVDIQGPTDVVVYSDHPPAGKREGWDRVELHSAVKDGSL